MLSKLSIYFHTLRHLKPQQIYRRLWFRLVRPKVDASPRPDLRDALGAWHASARRRPSLLAEDTFFFLNESGLLAALGWDGQQREKLWRYNQHYFDDLNAVDAAGRVEWHRVLLTRWVEENPPGVGVGWDPYPTSLRIVNWVKWQSAGHALPDQCLQSLAMQARWLSQRIEWHILGNHLFANAKAMVFAGLFFTGDEAQGWLGRGLGILERELPEQVLPDGGNFERSPMYHAIFLEDLLDLINLSGIYRGVIPEAQVAQWRLVAGKMLVWLQGMSHPDGEIAFFNDAAIGIAPTPAELLAYAGRLGIAPDPLSAKHNDCTAHHFSNSGYVRLQSRDAVALLDVAPVGPDYLPGHAHADTLSFELSMFGQRMIVNGGTSQYGSGPVRLQERGTAAHSTVEINGENSSEVWSGFRVARRAYPLGLVISEDGDSVSVSCAHDGYKRLPGQPVHRRSWQFSEGKLVIRDGIEGGFASAVARFHLYPKMQVLEDGANRWRLGWVDSPHTVRLQVLDGTVAIEPSFYAAEFGQRIASLCLAVRVGSQGSAVVEITWEANH